VRSRIAGAASPSERELEVRQAATQALQLLASFGVTLPRCHRGSAGLQKAWSLVEEEGDPLYGLDTASTAVPDSPLSAAPSRPLSAGAPRRGTGLALSRPLSAVSCASRGTGGGRPASASTSASEVAAPHSEATLPSVAAFRALGGHCGAEDAAAHIASPSPQLRRRACAALGARAAKGDAEELAVLLRDHDASVRRAATSALGQLCGGPALRRSARAADVASLLSDGDGAVRAAAVIALGQMGQEGAQHAGKVAQLLADREAAVRRAAVAALGPWRAVLGVPRQAAVHLGSVVPEVRGAAIAALVGMGDVAIAYAHQMTQLLLSDEDVTVRRAAGAALRQLGAAGAAEAAGVLGHGDAEVRVQALGILATLGEVAAPHAAAVAAALGSASEGRQDCWPVRLASAQALGRMGSAALPLAPKVALLLQDRKPAVRAAAVISLAGLLVSPFQARCR